MLEIKEIQGKAKTSPACSHCQNPAVHHCASCEVFMCGKCSESHNLWLKNHNVVSVKELSNPEKQVKMRNKLYCVKHEDEVLKLYCETCKELCCIHCLVLKHHKEDHSCVAVSDVAKKQKQALQSSCTTLDEKVCEDKQALDSICEVMKTLEKNAKTAKDQIEEQKGNILKMIAEKLAEKAKTMSEEVDKIYCELRKELSEQHDEIKDHLDKVQASVALPKTLLKKGSIEEILATQKFIDENVEKLTNEQPDDLTPVIDGVIEYVPGDIDKIKVNEIVSKLGDVGGTYRMCMDSSITLFEVNTKIE